MTEMDLTLWPGEWSLASFDPDSLSVLTYVKFGGLPVNLKTEVNLSEAPEGNVPYLEHDRNVSFGLRAIFEYLRKQNYGIEYDLSEEDLVRLNALMKTVEVELIPAVKHTWFLNANNFTNCTRRLYTRCVGFPRSLWAGPGLQARVRAGVVSSLVFPCPCLPDAAVERALLSNARQCLNSLSRLLGEQTYLLGERPTAVDAVVFGFLWPLMRAPLAENPLMEHLNRCPNLAHFCSRIHARFFQPPHTPAAAPPRATHANASNSTADGMESALSLTGLRNIGLFAVAAAAANFVYAYASNLVEVEVQES